MTSTAIYPCITEDAIANYQSTWLYVKRHAVTGLKYFGKTIQDPYKYKGSGLRWSNHLKVHGRHHVETLWCQQFDDIYELVEYALTFSRENDIVASPEWANLVPENGLGAITPLDRRAKVRENKVRLGKERWANTPEEKKLEIAENMRTSATDRWANMTGEEREKVGENVSKALREKRNAMSEDEREQERLKRSKAQTSRSEEAKRASALEISQRWQNRTPEEKHRYSKLRSEISKAIFANMSDEELASFSRSVSEGRAKVPPEREELRKQRRKATLDAKPEEEKQATVALWKRTNSSKSDEEKAEIAKKKSLGQANRTAEAKAETSKKLSNSLKGKPKPKTTCPHCGKEGNAGCMQRWHFDNCKGQRKGPEGP